MDYLECRANGYDLLRGTGIEVGGFEHPADPPRVKRVIRCDRITTADAARLFREIDANRLPVVDVCLDLDRDGLEAFPDDTMDFVICCHVLEHVKNPVRALAEFFRVLKIGGLAVLAVPDKDFTFDRLRPLTEWGALKKIHEDKVHQPQPTDYLDVIKYNHSDLLQLSAAELEPHLQGLMDRREHLNIWDSASFGVFLERALGMLRQRHQFVFLSPGEESQLEYFCIIKKLGPATIFNRWFTAPSGRVGR